MIGLILDPIDAKKLQFLYTNLNLSGPLYTDDIVIDQGYSHEAYLERELGTKTFQEIFTLLCEEWKPTFSFKIFCTVTFYLLLLLFLTR